MQLKHPYYYFKSALTEKQCADIISAGLSKMTIEKSANGNEAITAATADGKEKGGYNAGDESMADVTKQEIIKKKGQLDDKKTYVRDSHISWLNDRWIYDIFHPFIHEANVKAGWNYEWDFSESMQFTKYGPGQFYGWHADGSSDHWAVYKPAVWSKSENKYKIAEWDNQSNTYKKDDNGNPIPTKDDAPLKKNGNLAPSWTDNVMMWGKVRKLSMTCNLTNPDNYVGGDLKFDLGPHAAKQFHTVEEIRPKGSIIVFPSYIHHQVTPVTEGVRYSAVIWSNGKPFK